MRKNEKSLHCVWVQYANKTYEMPMSRGKIYGNWRGAELGTGI